MEELIVVSGLSGSGKSVALATLEDCGYYCIDNLPLSLIEAFLDKALGGELFYKKTAISIDSRNLKGGKRCWSQMVARLKGAGIPFRILFLRTAHQTLLRRFRETRRRHPLLREGKTLEEALTEEETLLEPVLAEAHLILDTTELHVHELRSQIEQFLCRGGKKLVLHFLSFGFKHGVPSDADFVFDARALPNPHWEPKLRSLTGCDAEVAAYLERFPETSRLVTDIARFLERWIPRMQNRSYITVAIGCTGGQHRSVYLTERLASLFKTIRPSDHIWVRHRDMIPSARSRSSSQK